jgi:predicted nucleic acid-binding protein
VIFDTNAVSAFADANAGVLQRLQEFSTTLSLPVVVLGEYR